MCAQFYLTPKSIDECLENLTRFDGRGVLVAGGTDLIPKLKERKIQPDALIDITEINGLDRLEIRDHDTIIGGAATHTQVNADPQITKIWPALSAACGYVGSPQIRNIATLSGNIANAQPAADAAVALVALGATAEIVSSAGSRQEKVENLYAGVGKSKIDSSRELITAIKVEKAIQTQGNAYGRISPRNSFCFPIVNAAAFLTSDKSTISSVRIVLGPVSDRPFRPSKAEQALRGARLDDAKAVEEAAILASREANPRNSCLRGCSDYRRELVKVLTKQVIEEASLMVMNS